MDKELEVLKELRRDISNRSLLFSDEKLDIIENALIDNGFYKHMISRICAFMRLDINPFENLVTTQNEILNHIVTSECYALDKNTVKKLKALEIIKKKEVNIHNFKKIIIQQDWTFEQYLDELNDSNTDRHQFSYYRLIRDEFDLLKEVLSWQI